MLPFHDGVKTGNLQVEDGCDYIIRRRRSLLFYPLVMYFHAFQCSTQNAGPQYVGRWIMAEKYPYLSPEWRDEVERRLKAELPPERMNFLTTSMVNIYRNCPDGTNKYVIYKLEEGEFTEVSVGEGEPPRADFRITGSYEVFAQISRAELKAHKALMFGKLRLRGNMVKALKLASFSDRMNKVIATVPTEF